MSWNAHFTLLARYNAWATDRLLGALQGLPDGAYRRDVGLFFRSIHGTLNHLLVGEQRLWFVRFAEGASPRVALDAEVETDRARLAASLREGAGRWAPLIASWAPGRWEGTLDYTTTRGVAASLPFAATLAHVFNHATHHRGQITAALTALGQPCPELDLAYFLQAAQTATDHTGTPP
ncbi:DinB family protein [Acidovorax sp. SRB_24]|uniref:DinB family protein n=1 Tax=Acidovorax sp. SRB_24 TaxID=1962700 RepID=UPI00145ED400|nr:DinB family protein [Acidovorax sp. SRB_24]NMM79073.1 damage-inducible protein DinB [Acidovorax sp. SRB_24]